MGYLDRGKSSKRGSTSGTSASTTSQQSVRSDSPMPEPSVTAGLEAGGGVQPGDTPPAADSMSGMAGGDREHTPNMGPVAGNRTPMIIALVLIGLMVLGVIGYGVAEIAAYLREEPGAEQSLGVLTAGWTAAGLG